MNVGDWFRVLVFLAAMGGAGWVALLVWQKAPWVLVLAGGAILAVVAVKTGRWLSATRETRKRLGRKLERFIAATVALTIALAIGFALAASYQNDQRQAEQQLRRLTDKGYVDTGEQVTKAECEAKGGHIEGDFCLTP